MRIQLTKKAKRQKIRVKHFKYIILYSIIIGNLITVTKSYKILSRKVTEHASKYRTKVFFSCGSIKNRVYGGLI